MLAKAIAAEKLIQVFHTHGGKIEGSDIAKDIVATVAEDGEGSEAAAEKLREAYRKVSKTPIIRFNSQPYPLILITTETSCNARLSVQLCNYVWLFGCFHLKQSELRKDFGNHLKSVKHPKANELYKPNDV